MTLSPALIIFDCDGTLADSQYLITEAMRHAFESAGLSAPTRPAILATVGLSIPETMIALASDQSVDVRRDLECGYREWCAVLRQRLHAQEPMFPGAAALLFRLAAREEAILGLATGKSRRGVQRFLEQNGLNNIFSTVQTADDAPSKPHPGMLLRAMAETGVSPEKTIMIGDTSYDMIMAACANVSRIGVTWGYHSVAELKRAGAQSIVRSFQALGQALDLKQSIAPLGAVA